MGIASTVDRLIEAPVVPSFTRVGYDLRSRLEEWGTTGDHDLAGRVMVVTGATSGLGLVTAEQLASRGAQVVLLGRSEERLASVVADLGDRVGHDRLDSVVADMGDLDAVRAAAAEIRRRTDRLDALVHNAGALSAERHTSPSGVEATVASQVVGPFLLTGLLLELLQSSAPSRVVTVSSGGMYTSGLAVSGLEMGDDYNGSRQYARAKRAQVTLNEMWAERFGDTGVHFHAMHPGWADTPGVAAALPGFRRVMGPLLRTPAQGADTIVWLAADDGPAIESSGGFWLDRRVRSIHKLRRTRRTDTPARRADLWAWCVERSGIDPGAST